MISNQIKIILVEDNFADARLLQKLLSQHEKYQIFHVELLSEALDCLSQRLFDIILLDLSLPDSQGLITLTQVVVDLKKNNHHIPIVVLTGLDDQEIAMQALRQGAQDYLIKGEINRSWLVRALQSAIERQQILDKIQTLNQKLVHKNEELEQFACIVSHDLQQPLQRIISFAQIISKKYQDRLDKKANTYINYITVSSIMMGNLTKDLLAYSRIGKSNLPKQSIDCNDLVKSIIKNLEIKIHNSGAIVYSESLPVIVGDLTELTQLFQNLIENAIKYSRKEQSPLIKISAQLKDNTWLFAIKDNGIGIKPEYFERIFEIFYTLNQKQGETGTGIGLAICKKIVTRFGGRIWVKSSPCLGSTFYFTIPTVFDCQKSSPELSLPP